MTQARTRTHAWVVVSGTILILAGCAAPPATLLPAPTESTPRTTDPTAPATETLVPNASWIELRDSVYEYGIAIPCWWWVIPPPAGGVASAMTLHSYDEAYFQANSTKGWWSTGDFPPGAFKMDIGDWPVEDPSLSTLDAAIAAFASDEQEVASAEEVTIGRNPAVDLGTRSTVNPDNVGRMIVFRLRPDTLLFASAYPLSAYDSPDIQGLLESLALAPGEPINVPTYPPSEPLIDLPAGCPAP